MKQKGLFDKKTSTEQPSQADDKIHLLRLLTKETLEILYREQNKSLEDIASQFNCSRQAIQYIMKKHGIQRRKRSEARVLAIKNNKFKTFKYDDINEEFFSLWSPGMAWVLGLIFTDGNLQNSVQNGLRVSISSVDYELLDKVRNLMQSKREIKKKAQSYDKNKYIYQFEFYREKMRSDIQELGLTERKSLTMQFPKVPEAYVRHFIRGCWDGDGSVYFESEKLRADYVTGSKVFIETLVEKLYKAGIHRKFLHYESEEEKRKLISRYSYHNYPLAIYKKHAKSPCFYIKISTKENLERLFNWLYINVNESMFLSRKYKIFVEGLIYKDKLA